MEQFDAKECSKSWKKVLKGIETFRNLNKCDKEDAQLRLNTNGSDPDFPILNKDKIFRVLEKHRILKPVTAMKTKNQHKVDQAMKKHLPHWKL